MDTTLFLTCGQIYKMFEKIQDAGIYLIIQDARSCVFEYYFCIGYSVTVGVLAIGYYDFEYYVLTPTKQTILRKGTKPLVLKLK